VARSHLDAVLHSVRTFADRYFPGNTGAVVTVHDRAENRTTIAVPDAETLQAIGADDDGPVAGSIGLPGCAVVCIGLLLEAKAPLVASEIQGRLSGHEKFPEFSLSSVEKTLAELVRVGLLRNPVGAKPRGYRFVDA
jgi:hypothetical protein